MPERSSSASSVFFALTGDIAESRKIEDRAAFQRAFGRRVAEVNRELPGEALAAPVELTAGDELQGLLRRPEAAVDIVVRIADAIHPVSMVWGLGRGELSTDLVPDVAKMDGPCFHRAREALESAVREGDWLRAAGFPEPHDRVVTVIFRLMGAIRSGWTEVQARYVREARNRLQKEVARDLGVSEPAVSKALRAAEFTAVKEGEESARALLRWLVDGDREAPESAP